MEDFHCRATASRCYLAQRGVGGTGPRRAPRHLHPTFTPDLHHEQHPSWCISPGRTQIKNLTFLSNLRLTCPLRIHHWVLLRSREAVPVGLMLRLEHPLRLRTPQDGRRRATRSRELVEVASDARAALPAPFARLRMEAQLYSLQASATRLTGKHWASPYASSLLARSRAQARCGFGALAPAPAAHELALR
jgi:hypothetical protein